jgi:hypothetical protein
VSVERKNRVVIADALRRAGLEGDPEEIANRFRVAGVPVSRDPRARWFADIGHPAVRLWLTGLLPANPDVAAPVPGPAPRYCPPRVP